MNTAVRTFSIHLPVFVWLLLVGCIVCFLLGYFQTEKVFYRTGDGRRRMTYQRRYDDDVVMCTAAAFGFAVVITCLRFSISLPSFWLWKIGLFGLVIGAFAVVFIIFWGIAETAVLLSHNKR